MKTINAMWLYCGKKFEKLPALSVRRSHSVPLKDQRITEKVHYQSYSYAQTEQLIAALGQGLAELGLKEQEGVALIAENCLEWIIADLAILGNRAYDVPRGVSSTDQELLYILKHSGTRFAVVQDKKELERLLKLKKRIPALTTFIVMDQDFKAIDPKAGVFSLNEVMELGRKKTDGSFQERRLNTGPEDIATLMYTSGTSGTPKGIPLTHANIMANVETIPFRLHMHHTNRFLSILPPWHILERTIEYIIMRAGASLWYTHRLTILKDLLLVRPTHMVSVPRIWITVYNGVKSNVRRSGKEELFNKLYSHSLKVMRARRYKQNRQHLWIGEEPRPEKAGFGDQLFHSLADFLIYSKVRKKLGGRFIAGVSGGGSLPEYIDDFFEIMGITILEGYGLTETSPVLCVRTFEQRIPYTVGPPLPDTELRVVDEKGKEIEDSSPGTLLVRGPQVMSGYYKNEAENKKVMIQDSEGKSWFNTGDLVRRTRSNDITIVGRIKETIVLIGGENVEPAPLETTLSESPLIDQIMICGQDQEFLAALIVPNLEYLEAECQKLTIPFPQENPLSLSANGAVKKSYMDMINSFINPDQGFKEIELIHDFSFTQPFAPEDDTLTHTLKIKRHNVQIRDASLIRAMYPHFQEGGTEKRREK